MVRSSFENLRVTLLLTNCSSSQLVMNRELTMPKLKQKSGCQKREERKKREARSTSGAQNISDFFPKKGESVKLAAQVPCGSQEIA